MKIDQNFCDCIYYWENHPASWEQRVRVREELLRKLPEPLMRPGISPKVLAVQTADGQWLLKCGLHVWKENQEVDIKKIHEKILEEDFTELWAEDFADGKVPDMAGRCVLYHMEERTR